MALKVALQMDPIGSVNIDADSTFRIALEAQIRGHRLFFYTPDRLAFVEGRVIARGQWIELRREKGNHVSFGEETEVDLADFDVVWLRQDPPFDMGYITTTHLLDLIQPKTLVVNDPFWVRNFPEKLLVLRFPDLTPRRPLPATLKRFAPSKPGMATSFSSRFTAMAAPVCSGWMRMTATFRRFTSSLPRCRVNR